MQYKSEPQGTQPPASAESVEAGDYEIVADGERVESEPAKPFVDWFASLRCPHCHGIYCGETCNGF